MLNSKLDAYSFQNQTNVPTHQTTREDNYNYLRLVLELAKEIPAQNVLRFPHRKLNPYALVFKLHTNAGLQVPEKYQDEFKTLKDLVGETATTLRYTCANELPTFEYEYFHYTHEISALDEMFSAIYIYDAALETYVRETQLLRQFLENDAHQLRQHYRFISLLIRRCCPAQRLEKNYDYWVRRLLKEEGVDNGYAAFYPLASAIFQENFKRIPVPSRHKKADLIDAVTANEKFLKKHPYRSYQCLNSVTERKLIEDSNHLLDPNMASGKFFSEHKGMVHRAVQLAGQLHQLDNVIVYRHSHSGN